MKKWLITISVFFACAALGWWLHAYITGPHETETVTSGAEVKEPESLSAPETSLPTEKQNTEIEGVKAGDTEARNASPELTSRMAYASIALSPFRHRFSIEPVSEKILDATARLSGLSSPQVSPDGKRIVFASGSEGSHDIWLIDLSGENLTQITRSPADEIDPSWMSDGKRIVYSSNETGTYELRIMNADGSGSHQITSDETYRKSHPRCSPIIWGNYLPHKMYKENTILYNAENDGTSGIWIVGEDGALPTPVMADTVDGENYAYAEWSPHGLTCVYTGEQNGRTRICQGWKGEDYGWKRSGFQAMDIESGACCPAFIPNGTKLTFLNPEKDGQSVFYCSVDGSDAGIITLKHTVRGNIAWSPDGTRFVHVTTVNGRECLAVQQVYYPLQDVTNLWQYSDYSPRMIDLLEKNRFAVTAKEHAFFHDMYEMYSRYYSFLLTYGLPVFITTDTTLELFHLFFDYTLRTLEQDTFSPLLIRLVEGCRIETGKLLKKSASPEMKEDLSFLENYFSVARELLSESRGNTNSAVAEELSLIERGDGTATSPVLGSTIDYTQFTVRGHYTKNESLGRYFRALMWLGTAPFRTQTPGDPRQARRETRRALVMTRILHDNPGLLASWNDLYSPILLFVGGADDFQVLDYKRLMAGVYTENTVEELYDERKLDRFLTLVGQEKPPRIAPQDGRTFRFMPQRFTPDSYIHQNLVFDRVGTSGNPRLLPRGLDIMAVLGSERAYEILDSVLGETRYDNYGTQVLKLRNEFRGMSPDEWQRTIYSGWLYTLTGLLPEFGAEYPQFMQNDAWRDKSLSTALASWTELRHDTILYVKQTAAEAGEGGEGWQPIIPKPNGYVEPNPEFYRRLKHLIIMSFDGLKEKNMLSGALAEKTDNFLAIVTRLESIAERELKKESLGEEDEKFIMDYGSRLEYLTIFFNEGESLYSITGSDVSLIADVATDRLNNRILHEAVGKVREMDVIVDIGNRKQINRGGIFTYYEFPVDGKRLNDDEWRDMLKTGKAPAPPVWTNTFRANE
ncbi:DUF3160 domain-containing protein [bacterium]|nr:DUF3160 domain-containing protein [bacterium]